MADNRPIGIFDSGIGGLTIARSVKKIMPDEQILFFGDTAHLPYGDKSTKAIQHYVMRISEFLLSQDCKMILIACNSASAAAYSLLHKQFGSRHIIVNVIDPVVDYIQAAGRYRKVGIIGTKRTISSRMYARKIDGLGGGHIVRSMATPLLAPMIEEGFFNNNISQTIINSYLSNHKLRDIEALVLACTHYPLIKNEIERYYAHEGKDVFIIDTTDVVAGYAQARLREKAMLAPGPTPPADDHFYVSDYTLSFQKTTQMFFGEAVKLEHIPIWK